LEAFVRRGSKGWRTNRCSAGVISRGRIRPWFTEDDSLSDERGGEHGFRLHPYLSPKVGPMSAVGVDSRRAFGGRG
jgi:hypothetical protein